MAKLLLNLYQVPDDEAADVRALLDRHRIEFYETLPNRWGISHGAIWIVDDEDAAEAKRLMAGYQGERQQRARSEYAAARRDGTAHTLWTMFRHDPLRMLLMAAGILVVLALTALPFFWTWG